MYENPFERRQKMLFFAAMKIIRWLMWAVIIFLTLQICREIVYQMSGVHTEDATIYSAVGRGLLHGLIPYRDLFETKPPGIFLLYAASFWVFNSDMLLRILEGVILLLIPILIAFSTEKRGLGLLFGCIITIYTAYECQELQVESYGVFFCVLCIFLLLKKQTWPVLVGEAICFVAAIGMKEPFLLSMMSSALILRRWIVIPAAMGLTAGMLFMWITGFLVPYVTIYLPYMTGFHIHRFGSPVIRAFDGMKIASNLYGFSAFFLLAIAAMTCFILFRFYKEKKTKEIIFLILALFLSSLAVGMGGEYLDHHFVFAVPAYICIFIIFARMKKGIIVPILLFLCIFHAQTAYAERSARSFLLDAQSQQAADQLDSILDFCTIDRYRIIGDIPFPIYGYTKHIPLGPAFFQYPLYMYQTGFKESFVKSLLDTKIIITGEQSRALPNAVVDYINSHFTLRHPSCAKNSVQGFVVLYRTQ